MNEIINFKKTLRNGFGYSNIPMGAVHVQLRTVAVFYYMKCFLHDIKNMFNKLLKYVKKRIKY